MMKLSMMLKPYPEREWKIAKQIGVDYAVTNVGHRHASQALNVDFLRGLQGQFADVGLELHVIEADPFPMDRIKLGLDGRDEDIERYCDLIRAMGELEIPLLCYNFMARIGWLRTRTDIPTRGGALTSRFDYADLKDAPLTDAGEVSEERVWENYLAFMERVLPVAEDAGVRLALHPDDPPISPIRGIGRIFTSPESFDRAFELFPSKWHGLALCQGNFLAMGGDLCETIRHFGSQGRIFFAHLRDIRGDARCFEETFHDDGPTDMLQVLRCYKEVGFEGPIRPDHAPSLEGEDNARPGYGTMGRVFAVGYMKGLIEALA